MIYPGHCCQMCGAPIGYVGRSLQFLAGCGKLNRCRGSDFHKMLMNLPTARWYVAVLGAVLLLIVVATVLTNPQPT